MSVIFRLVFFINNTPGIVTRIERSIVFKLPILTWHIIFNILSSDFLKRLNWVWPNVGKCMFIATLMLLVSLGWLYFFDCPSAFSNVYLSNTSVLHWWYFILVDESTASARKIPKHASLKNKLNKFRSSWRTTVGISNERWRQQYNFKKQKMCSC